MTTDPFPTPDEIRMAHLEDELAKTRAELSACESKRRDAHSETREQARTIKQLQEIIGRLSKGEK